MSKRLIPKNYAICIVNEELSNGIETSVEISDTDGNAIYIPITQANQFIGDLTIELGRYEQSEGRMNRN